jgi:DNA-binding transcriptional regulator LsrR (DeoR family)
MPIRVKVPRERIVELYRQGVQQVYIARRLGLTSQIVSRTLKAAKDGGSR